jgi:Rrf2 family protein
MAKRSDLRVSATELSRRLKIPYPFLRTILQTLNAQGILTSLKGKGGGFALARAPEKIYLTELIKILQGPVNLAECIFRASVCPGSRTCRLRKVMLRLQKIVVAELKSITLASMFEESVSGRDKHAGRYEPLSSGKRGLSKRSEKLALLQGNT